MLLRTATRLSSRTFTQQLLRHVTFTLKYFSTSGHYITTPIFYVNASPHIGHLHSMVLADVIHRYEKLKLKYNTKTETAGTLLPPLLATGTDEHGLKIERAAKENGIPELEFCDLYSDQFKRLAQLANIDVGDFIRTTEPRQTAAVQHLWRKLRDAGYIYKGSHAGWYSIADEAYYTDTQVIDENDFSTNTTKKVSIETGRVVEWVEEVNYKFRLEPFRESLIKWLNQSNSVEPQHRREEVLASLQEPLPDLSISRPKSRLSWGIKVPDDDEHTVYVWFDALINYLTVTGYPWKEDDTSTQAITKMKGYWPPAAHVIGKDIIRFHAVYWPTLLMAAQLPLPKSIIAHSHWTVERAKMSKSTGNVVNPFELLDELNADPVRFYLMRVGGGLANDSDFSYEQFAATCNKELIGQYGNPLNRVTSRKVLKNSGINATSTSNDDKTKKIEINLDQIPTLTSTNFETDKKLYESLENIPKQYVHHMESRDFQLALESIFNLLRSLSAYISDFEPWQPHRSLHENYACVWYAIECIRIASICLEPFMPFSTNIMLDRLGIDMDKRSLEFIKFGNSGGCNAFLSPNHLPPSPLFKTFRREIKL